MPRVAIASLDDPRLAPFRQLKASNATRSSQTFIVEGAKLVERLIASRYPVVSVVATERKLDSIAPTVPPDVPLYGISDNLADVLVGFNFHQGVLACGGRRAAEPLDVLLARTPAPVTLLAAPRLDNPENLGAILRLADVLGAAAVLVGPGCPDPLSRRVLRVSMGMALRVPLHEPPDLRAELQRIHEQWAVERVAAVADEGALPFDRYERPDRVALLLGREASGLEEAWLADCERRLVIPMRPGAESLNVAVAAGILLYHLTRPTC